MRRQRRGWYKKAVSPLIATVLLISFAVALGSVVLNWGRNLEISNSEDICTQAVIEVLKESGNEVCYTQKSGEAFIRFKIENTGKIPIQGLGVWIIGQKGTKLLDFDEFAIAPDKVLEIKGEEVGYNIETFGTVKAVQFIPKVRSDDALEICPSNSVKAEDVRPC